MKGIVVVVLLIVFVWIFWMSREWLTNTEKRKERRKEKRKERERRRAEKLKNK